MLKKFITIKNVGKFRNCNAQGDIEFRKLSLIYAENGRGKTTLASILRSLQARDPLYLLERRTIDSTVTPRVELLKDFGKITFADGTWSGSYPQVVIFDATFVSENVYSGDFVDLDHKKRLYQVTIGSEGVTLAKKVTDLDMKSRQLAQKIKEKKESLARKIPAGFTLDQFIRLLKDDQIDAKIEEQLKILKGLENLEAVKTRSGFQRLSLPTVPESLSDLLARTLSGLETDVEKKIKLHLKERMMGDEGELWLARGVKFGANEVCPFCGQGTKGNVLLDLYRVYFSEAYSNLKGDVFNLEKSFSQAFSDKAVADRKNTVIQNQANAEFWAAYASVSLPDIQFESKIEPVLQAVAKNALELIKQKSLSPLEPIKKSSEAEAAFDALAGLRPIIDAYNTAVDKANAQVAAAKKSLQAAKVSLVKQALGRLETVRLRHSSEMVSLCGELDQLQSEKQQVETDKTNTKANLDQYTDKVLKRCETEINRLLDRFGTGFRISGTKQQYLGGSPSSTFKLAIDQCEIELGDPKTPRGTPCFRTSMSAGDRTTLALAFFLAQLRHRSDLSNLTVVFDDPFSSMDRFRLQFTRDKTRQVVQAVKQVIVLSHEPLFLSLIADDFDAAQLRLLQIARQGISNSVILEWNMEKEMTLGHHKDIATLLAYHGGETCDGGCRAVVRCIRPVLEGHLRMTYTGQFTEGIWLGEMLQLIRNCSAGSHLEPAKQDLPDYESLNDYTKRYHHDNNTPRPEAGSLQDEELVAMVRLCLRLIGRL